MTNNKFEWCGYQWESCMEGGRIIHPGQPWMWYDSEMTTVDENGILTLYAEKKPKDIKYWDGTTYHATYAVGTIRSVNGFGYGRYSCDIQLPDGNNCWPSFWLTGFSSWPPEIDIMEAFQNGSSYFRLTIPQPPYLIPSWWTTNNAHFLNEEEVKQAIGSRGVSLCKQFKNPKKRFVNYACEWVPGKVTFYVDGKKIRTAKGIPNLTPQMRVVFDLWGEETNLKVTQPMKCKNFEYEKL